MAAAYRATMGSGVTPLSRASTLIRPSHDVQDHGKGIKYASCKAYRRMGQLRIKLTAMNHAIRAVWESGN
jgi:hypothetical protein